MISRIGAANIPERLNLVGFAFGHFPKVRVPRQLARIGPQNSTKNRVHCEVRNLPDVVTDGQLHQIATCDRYAVVPQGRVGLRSHLECSKGLMSHCCRSSFSGDHCELASPLKLGILGAKYQRLKRNPEHIVGLTKVVRDDALAMNAQKNVHSHQLVE